MRRLNYIEVKGRSGQQSWLNIYDKMCLQFISRTLQNETEKEREKKRERFLPHENFILIMSVHLYL